MHDSHRIRILVQLLPLRLMERQPHCRNMTDSDLLVDVLLRSISFYDLQHYTPFPPSAQYSLPSHSISIILAHSLILPTTSDTTIEDQLIAPRESQVTTHSTGCFPSLYGGLLYGPVHLALLVDLGFGCSVVIIGGDVGVGVIFETWTLQFRLLIVYFKSVTHLLLTLLADAAKVKAKARVGFTRTAGQSHAYALADLLTHVPPSEQ